ncbi:Acetyltransferase (GNAT) domain-containing protein [Daejeonella rubra]|uniref:Acetyltransferase (GNAT) domain-containing protein n=1 Tax=Daejeonella rubra TaxID=990371 RepID=A0A1G9YR29_9SPHI|nr:GNAT family N-acetyltransferase [Daejeonella rubra]SDN11659.1 Acetyltransferase (GNAT) domain-containing protein [Daejeonella rubra]
MIKLLRTDANNPDFKELIILLDAGLAITDGEDHTFYSQFNKVDHIKYVIIAYENSKAVACGAIKKYDENTMEVKRMFTSPESRGKGLASMILAELQNWAKEMDYKRCILETGIRQKEAVSLYNKTGFILIPNYGQYEGIENSICFEKTL